MNPAGFGEDIGLMSEVLAKTIAEHLAAPQEFLNSVVIVPEAKITEVINIENLASAVHGVTDILGQISGFIQSIVNAAAAGINAFVASVRDAIIGTVRSVGDSIVWAVADFTARVVTRLIDYMGPRFVELGYAVAGVIREIGSAIASATLAITTSLATSINILSTTLSGAIAQVATSLGIAITQVATSLSGAITMLGTSLSAAIASIGYSISQSILSVATSLSAAIASLGASLGQAILSVSTAISVGISQLATALAGAVVSLSTAISGAVVQITTAVSVGITQLATSLSSAILQVSASLSAAMVSLATSLGAAINAVATAISGAIASMSTALSTAIMQVGTSLTSVFGGLLTTIVANVMLIQGRVEVAIAIMRDFFPVFSEKVADNLRKVSAAVEDVGRSVGRAIADISDTISTTLKNNFDRFIETLSNNLERISGTILSVSERTVDTLNRNMVRTIDAIATTGERLSNALASMHRSITDSVISSFETASRAIRNAFSDFMDTLRTQFGLLSDTLREKFKDTIDAITDSGKKVMDFIEDSSKRMTDVLTGNLAKFIEELTRAATNLSDTINRISSSAKEIADAILGLPERSRPYFKHFWHALLKEELQGWDVVWNEAPKFFKKASPFSPFESLNALIVAAAKAHPFGRLEILPGGNPGHSPNPGPHPVETELVAMYAVSPPETEHVAAFSLPSELFRPLLSSFSAFVVPALEQLWQGITKAISTLANMIISGFQTIFDAIIKGFVELFKGMGESFLTMSTGVYSALAGKKNPLIPTYAQFIEREFGELLNDLLKLMDKYSLEALKQIYGLIGIDVEQALKRTARSPPPELQFAFWARNTGFILLTPIFGGIAVRAAAVVLHKVASFIYNLSIPIRINLRPLGIGVDFTLNLAQAIGGTLSHFAATMKDNIDSLTNGLIYGLAIWISQPLAKMLNSFLRNSLPVEVPTLHQAIEITRRYMPFTYEQKEMFEDTHKLMLYYMAIQGHPDQIIRAAFQTEKELFVAITDRFNQQRRIPLSLMYDLPSSSDVARMVIRDIIIDPDAIKKMFAARGMNEDISAMYYLLHFRYPPPERLWTFYSRGISGLLWARITPAEVRVLEREAKIVKGFVPVSPAELNFKHGVLDEMLKTYMKWHDYARFAYAQGWPSDNLMVIDTLADIPTKIDQRWMVRFGLYQLLSDKGVTLDSDVSAFAIKVVEGTAKSNIRLDLTNFCRTLQATGLHPYYVPITAVAEVINTISDERTLLRTGVINLYKEGFFDTTAVVRMLTGVLNVSFDVAYFDQATGTWKAGVINVPLRYLEMEARLIALRAVMDRALDILRDIQKDVLVGYSEFIIADYDEFKKRFSEVINRVNAVYAEDFRRVAGQDPPPELVIRYIDEYYKPLVDSYDIWREIYTIRRMRMMTQRWLGWLMFRIATGIVEPEELDDLVKFMAKETRMPKIEYEYLKKVMEFMAQLSLREYIPSPWQMATLAEYIKLPDSVVEKAMKKRGVPEEWRPIWRDYISIRPLANDVRALITAFLRLVRAVKKVELIPQEIRNAVRSFAAKIGFTDQEMAILDLRVRIEEMISEMKEYIPTPMQLATMAENVVLPDSLVNMVFETRNVPREWREVWIQYIRIRPLADDVRDLIRSYLRALSYTPDAKAFEGFVLSMAGRVGYMQEEMNILRTRIQLEEMIYNAREYIPTPFQLATLVELVPEARDLFDEVVRVRRIPDRWRELWDRYIDLRALADDYRRLLSRAEQLYVRFMIRREDFTNMINDVLNSLGYTTTEKELLMRITELERWRNAWVELIGTVDRLVALSEYSPRAASYALAKVREMIDALPLPPAERNNLREMWEEYIRNRPVKAEARAYITQLSNVYAEGLLSRSDLVNELNAMRQWGFSDNEIMFYLARADLMRARKLRIPIMPG